MRVIGALILIPTLAQAGVYTCKDPEGNTVFSQVPCGETSQEVDIRYNYRPKEAADEPEAATKDDKPADKPTLEKLKEERRQQYNIVVRLTREQPAEIEQFKREHKDWDPSFFANRLKELEQRHNSTMSAEMKKLREIESRIVQAQKSD